MPRFVIQKHAARRLHYDFRLEVAGVLKSWAVPKGPSMNPRDRRLAVQVEDHALHWGDFEGTLPEGTYGAGSVLVWDTGRYRNLSEQDGKPIPMERALERGRATFRLEGKKLRGGFVLMRMHGKPESNWLLIKLDDEEADPEYDPVRTRPESVLTGRTLEEISRE